MKKFVIWGISISLILGAGMYFMIGDSEKKNNGSNVVIEEKQDIEDKLGETATIDDGNDTKGLSDNVRSISQVGTENKGDIVKIKGEIIKKNSSKGNDIFLDIKDETGIILVPVFKDKDIDRSSLAIGTVIEVTGKVDIYNGEIEVIPEYKTDIEIINNTLKESSNSTENKNIKDDGKVEIDSSKKYSSDVIDNSKIGEIVLVEGDVLSKYNHENGHVFLYIKTNGNTRLNVPIFSSAKYDASDLDIGSNVSVSGEVQEYKGQIQVVPRSSGDIKIN